MKGLGRAFNSAAAVYRVLVAPLERTQLPCVHRAILSSFIQGRVGLPLAQRRTLIVDTVTKAEKFRLPRNTEITSPTVVIVDEHGKLSEPRSTRKVLEALDLNKYDLQCVTVSGPGRPPICKINDKNALRKREFLLKKNTRKNVIGNKSIELNWAIEKGDLKHRLNKLRDFLEKGLRVEVMLASKRKGRRADEEEARAVVNQIEATVKDIPGLKEYKSREGKLLQQFTISYEAKKAKAEVAEAEAVDTAPETSEISRILEALPGLHGIGSEEGRVGVEEVKSRTKRMRWQPEPAQAESELNEMSKKTRKHTELMQKRRESKNPKAQDSNDTPAMAALRRAIGSR